MGELSDGPATMSDMHHRFSALNEAAKRVSVEYGRVTYALKKMAQVIGAGLRRSVQQKMYEVPPHPFMVGSYDLECRYPNCGLGPEDH